MESTFEIIPTNYVGFSDPEKCSVERLKPWIRFLNEHPLMGISITRDVPLKIEPLRILCSTAVVPKDNCSFSFQIQGTTYTVNPRIINEALGFPTENFQFPPTPTELTQFFTNIRYQEEINLNRLKKSGLVQEWDLYFDTLSKVFGNCTRKNYNIIPSSIQFLGFCLAYNRCINFGHLIFNLLVHRIRTASVNFANGNHAQC